jgi:hypothetical protein
MATPSIGVYAATYGPYVQGGTPPPTNQAPSVTINGTATGTVGTQQSFQAIASDSDGQVVKVELCLMANASTLTGYTVLDTDLVSPFVLNWTPSSAGNFNLRMRATDDKGATSFSSVLAVQVATAPVTGGTDQLIAFADSDFANSVRYPDANTLSPFATAMLSTNSPYLDLDVSCAVQNAGHGDYQAVAVYVNGVYDGTTTSGAARTITRYTFTQAAAGQVTVQLVTSGQERPQDQNDAAGSVLYSAQGAPGTATSKVAVVRKSKRIYVFGDSLCNGIGTTPSQRYAWVRVFLAAHPDYEICVEGSGWHSASRSYQTAALRQAAADRALAWLAGATEAHTIQMLAANDFLNGWGTAADVSAFMGDLADKIHAGRSSIVVHVSTGLNIAPAKASGWESYRTALRGLNNNARNTWLRIIDGASLVDVSKVSGDGVHYSAAGYADEAANIFAVLGAAPTGPVVVPPVDAGTMVTTLDAAANSYWEVQNSEYTNFLGTYPALTIVLEMELSDYSKNQFLFSKQVSAQTASDRTLGIYLFNNSLYAEFFANSVRYELSISASLLGLVGGQRYVVAFRYNSQGVSLFCNNQLAITGSPGSDLAVSSTPIRFGAVLSQAGAGLAYTYGVLRNVSILARSYSDAEITTLRGNRGVLSSSQLAEAATLGSWPLTRKDATSPLSLNLVSGASPVALQPRPSAVIPAGATVQENDARITTTGTWQIYNSGDSFGGSRQYVNGGDEGAKSFTTTATVLTLRNQVAPYCGELGIYVDGNPFATWNQYAGSEQVGSFTTPPMPAGTKQVELRKTTPSGAYLIIIDQLEFS